VGTATELPALPHLRQKSEVLVMFTNNPRVGHYVVPQHKGVPPAELVALLGAAGVQQCWQVTQRLWEETSRQRHQMLDEAVEKNATNEDYERIGEILDELDARRPLWRWITRLSGDASPQQRSENILALLKLVEKLARYELAHFHPKQFTVENETEVSTMHAIAVGSFSPSPPLPVSASVRPDPRTFLWDPLPEICNCLGISHSKLSQLCREVTGMTAHELLDRIRAETVKDQMRANLRTFVERLATEGTESTEKGNGNGNVYDSPCATGSGGPSPLEGEGRREREARTRGEGSETDVARSATHTAPSGAIESSPGQARRQPRAALGQVRSSMFKSPGGATEELPYAIWQALKKSRRAPDFDRATYAIGFGFKNYQRFYRACLLYYGKTPGQLEIQVIREILAETERQNGRAGDGPPESGAEPSSTIDTTSATHQAASQVQKITQEEHGREFTTETPSHGEKPVANSQ
jgi:AraC-like DNA-binding protein